MKMMCRRIGFIFFLAVAYADRYHTPVNCPLDHINYDPRFGLINEIDVADEFQCIAECDNDGECVAYNIELSDVVCEFNEGATNEYGDDMVQKDGWTYWEKNTVGEETDTCEENYLYERKQRELTSHGTLTHVVGRGGRFAWWGKDTFIDDPRIYYVPDYSNREDLYEYPDEANFKSHTNYKLHYISPRAVGSQWIIYNGQFWYRENNLRRLLAWNITNDQLDGQIYMGSVEGGTYGPSGESCAYDWRGSSSADLEVDEAGRIYMIYGNAHMDCSLRISVINPHEYRIVRTYGIEGMIKSWGGTGFIIDDIYYMTDHYNARPTWIMVEWNLRNTSTYFRQVKTANINNAISWEQPASYNSHTHWNPVEQRLYSSYGAQHYTAEPTFIELP